MSDEIRFVSIASYSDSIEAGVAQSLLIENGIDAIVTDVEAATTLWHAGLALGGVKVEVPFEQAQAAQEILNAETQVGEWVCKCGERIEAGFAVCWQCGASVDGSTESTTNETVESSDAPIAIDEPEETSSLDTRNDSEISPEDEKARQALKAAILSYVFCPIIFFAINQLSRISKQKLSDQGLRHYNIALVIAIFWWVVILGLWFFEFGR